MIRRDWLTPVMAGGVIGAAVLGLLGRVAMRVIAVANDQAPVGSVGGTVTVVALGFATGAGFGLVFAIAQRVSRGNQWLRNALFGTICLLVTLRGLRPLTPLALSLFIPLVILFGVLLHLTWQRLSLRPR